MIFANLASTATATDGTTFSLPSVNIDANALILVSLNNSKAASPDAATLTGLAGATWDTITTISFNSTSSPGNRHTLFRTMVGTSANGVTVTASFGGATQTGFSGIIDAVTGCSTSGTNGSGAVAQVASTNTGAAGQTITVTFTTSPSRECYVAFAKTVNADMGTPAGFTEGADTGAGTPAKRSMTAWSTTPTTAITSTQPGNAIMAGIAIELISASTGAAGGVVAHRRMLVGVGF